MRRRRDTGGGVGGRRCGSCCCYWIGIGSESERSELGGGTSPGHPTEIHPHRRQEPQSELRDGAGTVGISEKCQKFQVSFLVDLASISLSLKDLRSGPCVR